MGNVFQQIFTAFLKSDVTVPALQLGIVMAILALFLAVRLYRFGLILAFVFLYWRTLHLMRQCGSAVFTAYLIFGAIASLCAIIGFLLGSNDD